MIFFTHGFTSPRARASVAVRHDLASPVLHNVGSAKLSINRSIALRSVSSRRCHPEVVAGAGRGGDILAYFLKRFLKKVLHMFIRAWWGDTSSRGGMMFVLGVWCKVSCYPCLGTLVSIGTEATSLSQSCMLHPNHHIRLAA